MPGPYSLDLRRKAVSACEKGEDTQKEIAEQFDIGYRTLKEWIFLKKNTGDVIPKEHIHRGPLPLINEKGLIFIKNLVKKKPDILILEIRDLYAKKFGIEVAQTTIFKALCKLDLRRKKKSEYASEQEREDIKKKGKNGKAK
jgi:transposase